MAMSHTVSSDASPWYPAATTRFSSFRLSSCSAAGFWSGNAATKMQVSCGELRKICKDAVCNCTQGKRIW